MTPAAIKARRLTKAKQKAFYVEPLQPYPY